MSVEGQEEEMYLRRAGRLTVASVLSVLAVALCTGFNGTDRAAIEPALALAPPTDGGVAALWSGSIVATATVEGTGQMLLGAAADYCEGWPTVRVVVDGVEADHLTITNTERFQYYLIGKVLGPGAHRVEV